MIAVLVAIATAHLLDYALLQYQKIHQAKVKRQWKLFARIDMPGVDHIDSPPRPLLQTFGLTSDRVLDLCVITGPCARDEMTPQLLSFLGKLYAQGCALGTETRDFLFGRRSLAAGEGLYLVSLDDHPKLHYLAIIARA